MKVISFYTDRYKAYVDGFRESCAQVGVEPHIVHKPDSGSWLKNVNLKPRFICRAIAEFEQILYLDIDMLLVQHPQPLFDLLENADFTARPWGPSGKRSKYGPFIRTGVIAAKPTAMPVFERWANDCTMKRAAQVSGKMKYQSGQEQLLWAVNRSIPSVRFRKMPEWMFEILGRPRTEPGTPIVAARPVPLRISKPEMAAK